ncbi:MAG: fibronectin type III domain-containing protein [Opitutaceae bacterium]|jgi:alpha-tubulin suppressor-like RCC1 family protein
MNCFKAALVFAVAALGLARAEPNVTVQGKTYANGAVVNEWAQYTLQTSGTVAVTNGADVTFSAGNSITLYPGFAVESGSVFQAVVSASPGYSPGGYYDAITPTLTVVSGDQQSGQVNQFNLQPFDVAAWNTVGTAPLVNAPVLMTVSIGDGWLATTNGVGAVLSKSLQLITDSDGAVSAYYQQGPTEGVTSYIQAVAGGQSVQFTTFSISDSIAPSAPSSLAASNLDTTDFTLTWSASTDNVGVTGYDIFKNGVQIGTAATLNYAVTGLAPLTGYSMTVKARDAAGNVSADSAALSVTTTADTAAPTAPTGLSASAVATTGFTLSWVASTDNVAVTDYDIFKDGVQIGSSATLTYDVSGLAPLTAYNMTVKARDAAGNVSAASQALSITTLADTAAPAAPTGLAASNLGLTSFTLSWSAAADNVAVTGYDVFQGGVLIGSTPTLDFTVVNLTADTAYAMTVKAKDAAANVSAASTVLTVTTPADVEAPSVPTGLVASDLGAAGFTITWSASTDNVAVAGYDIFQDGVQVGSSTAPSYSVTGLDPLTGYSMTVKARDAAGNLSAASAALSVTTTADTAAPTVPIGLSATAVATTSFTLNWLISTDNVAVSSYAVFKNDVQIGSSSSLAYAVGGLSPLTAYNMTVKAVDAAGNLSAASTVLVVTTTADTAAPVQPSGLVSSSVAMTSFTLSWNISTDNVGVTGYDIYKNGVQIGSSVSPDYAVTGLTPGTVYTMTVTARDAAGNVSTASAVLPVTTVADTAAPSVPSGFAVSALDTTSFTLSWAPSLDNIGTIGYDIFKNGQFLGTTLTPSYAVTGLAPLTAYNMTVMAKDAAGNVTAASAVQSVTTAPDTAAPTAPTNVTASGITATGFILNWVASTDNVAVTAYDIFKDGVQIDFTTDVSYPVMGLDPLTAYNMTVKARDAANNVSVTSASLPVTTAADTDAPTAPGNLASSNVTTTSFTLNWTASADNVAVTGYDVYLDDVLIDSTTSLSYAVANLAASTTYNMKVKSRDEAGNVAVASTEVTTQSYLINDQVSVGANYTLALKKDGTVWSWGYNYYGQLGQGNAGEYWYPAKIESLAGVKAISAGTMHSLALKSDGTVWAWGYNYYGQVGDGTTTQRLAPVAVTGLPEIVAIAAGENFSLALDVNGKVWAWGYNYYNQLGDGTTTTRLSPVAVNGLNELTNVIAIDAGLYFGVALKSDGTVWVWGSNGAGELGTNYNPSISSTPIRSGTITNVVAIAAGARHVLALKTDGGVSAWGYNVYGQLGDNTTNNRGVAGAVTLTGQYTAIAAGQNNSAALKSDGTLYTWGENSYGEIGNGTTVSPVKLPAAVAGLTGVTAIATGQHTVAANTQGEIYSWGYNNKGQLGQGTNANQVSFGLVQAFTFASQLELPTLVPDGGQYLTAPTVTVASLNPGVTLRYTLDGTEPTAASASIASGGSLTPPAGFLKVKAFKAGVLSSETKTAVYQFGDQVSVGANYTLALKKDGTVWSWGYNYYGQLGQGNAGEYWYPAKIESLAGVKAISAGTMHSLALKSDGTVWAWGYNYYGQVGDGTTTQRLAPVAVTGLPEIVAIAAGENFSLALDVNGKVWAWGYNYYNQLGDGTTTTRLSPVAVNGQNELTNVVAIDAGLYFGVALKSDGTVWAWGGNNYGELGTSYNPSISSTPIRSGTITNVVALAAGARHVLALKTDGSVSAWGSNSYGQLGDNTTNNRGVAGAVTLTGQYTAIAAGQNNSAALKSDGILYTWGENSYGEIGNGTTVSPVKLPAAVAGLTGVTAIATGQHTVAANTQGEIYSWGYNNNGQLGQGTNANQVSFGLVQAFPFSNQLTLPIFTPDGGDYLTAPLVTVASIDLGVTLRYTLDGTEPTEASASIASGGTLVPAAGFLKVKAFKAGLLPSETKTAVYQFGDQVSVGEAYTLALKRDGTVWSWGANNNGQLGQGNMGEYWYPAKIESLAGVKAISAGATHSLALKSDGTVWAWGDNSYGQLGDDTTIQQLAPVAVTGLPEIVAIAAGENFSFALDVNGKVWAWGYNYYNQLGDGTATTRLSPVAVNGLNELTNVIAIDAGLNFGVALKSDGTVWAWGSNGAGELGTNYNPSISSTPIRSGTITNVVAIAAGARHVLVLKTDGSVSAWGYNAYGQLGDNTNNNRGVAGAVTLTGQYTVIAAGQNNSAALKSDGTLYTWGENSYGQVGNGTTVSPVKLPAAVAGLTGVTAIATGQHTVAANTQGEIYSWGYNSDGQLGQGTNISDKYTPDPVQGFTFADQLGLPTLTPDGSHYPNPPTVTVASADSGITLRYTLDGTEPTEASASITSGGTLVPAAGFLKVKAFKAGVLPSETKTAVYQFGDQIAAGEAHSLALKQDGTVWSWGRNTSGELGQGNNLEILYPTRIESLTGMIAISAGLNFSLALKADGTVWAWGYNGSGQLGDGTTTQRLVPVAVPGLTGVVAIAAGANYSLALKSDGTVWAWGDNGYSQLGDGTQIQRLSPVQVSGLTGVIAIVGSQDCSLALKSDGTVWAWGYNNYGQFGTNYNPSTSSTPIQSGVIINVVSIAAGDLHVLALKADGSVWAWGNNGYGQLGNTSTNSSGLPGAVVLSGKYVAISAGGYNSAALKSDGTLYTWGDNGYGQIGDDTVGGQIQAPLAVAGLLEITAMATGRHTLAVKGQSLDQLYAWGNNSSGQLGNGSLVSTSFPFPKVDSDGDGFYDYEEDLLGSNPLLADTNGDGITDYTAFILGVSLTATDVDDDGISNADEIALGLDPQNPDTDGDGVDDGLDAFPLDPTRTVFGPPVSGDVTAPVITLDAPAGAVLVP